MNDMTLSNSPSKLVPVFIGGLAMTATAVIPMLNLINCLCCAGIMGGAILGVWFYKKNFPADAIFTVGDGAVIGALSGLVGAGLTAIIQALQFGIMSGGSVQFEEELDEALQQMESAGQDPAALEAAREFITQMVTNPMMFFLVILVASMVIFVGFGALGGVIGGNIFKTKTVAPAAGTGTPIQ